MWVITKRKYPAACFHRGAMVRVLEYGNSAQPQDLDRAGFHIHHQQPVTE